MTNKSLQSAKNQAAKSEVKSAVKSYMYWVKQLNKLAERNEFTSGVAVRKVGEQAKGMLSEGIKAQMKKNQYFHLAVFTPDYQRRPCLYSKYTDETLTVEDLKREPEAVFTDSKQRQVVISVDGQSLLILRPLSCTLQGVLAGYCSALSIVAKGLDREAKEQRQAEREARKAQREFNKKLAALRKQYAAGELSGAAFRAAWAKLEEEQAAA